MAQHQGCNRTSRSGWSSTRAGNSLYRPSMPNRRMYLGMTLERRKRSKKRQRPIGSRAIEVFVFAAAGAAGATAPATFFAWLEIAAAMAPF